MLIRFRERFEWRRGEVGAGAPVGPTPGATIATTGRVAAILLAVLLLGAFASTRAEAAPKSGPKAAVAWLEGAQNTDGGWGEKAGADSAQEMTGWAMLGLEAAGVNPQDVTSGGKSPVDFLQGRVAEVQSPGDLARTILALEGAGVEPREFGGRNLVAALLAKRRKDGSYEGWPNTTAYAVLALRDAGIANVADSVTWLREAQNEDGGWGDTAGAPSNADGTGAVLQVLSPSSKPAKQAVDYLRQVQQKGGGYRLGGNGALNTQSTAWAVEGLLAAGGNPAEFKRGGKSALEYLEANQAGDGHYRYSSKSDQTPVWVTGQVLVAAAKKYLPLEAPARAPKPKAPKPTPTPTPTPTPEPLPLPEEGGVTPVPTPTPEFPTEAPHVESSPPKSHHGGKKGNQGTPGVGATPGGTPPTEVPGTDEGALPEDTSPIEPMEEEPLTGTPAAEAESDSDSGGSVLGSIVAGLLAGGLLFAIGFGPYKRWRATHQKGAPPPSGGAGGSGTPGGPAPNGASAAPGVPAPNGAPGAPGAPPPPGGPQAGAAPPPVPPAINGSTPHAPVAEPPPPPRRYS